ncbi:MAG TPA: hypothetical protein VGM53_13520 [Streptosporangiaceae bacterium]|jgi:hypothetical protein
MPNPGSFLPSRDAFAFTNAWPSEPAVKVPTPFGDIGIGNAAAGLCGGMVFAALDYQHAAAVPPATRPAPGQPLYRYIVRRLIDSWHLPVGVAEYYQWMNMPQGDTGIELFGRHVVIQRGAAWHTIETQWPQIAAGLDTGTPAALGLVTVASANPAELGHNHQALAYRYEASPSQITVWVYDPNSGRDDGIYIRFDPRTPTGPTTFTHNLNIARPLRGFFRTAYAPATPPRSVGLRRSGGGFMCGRPRLAADTAAGKTGTRVATASAMVGCTGREPAGKDRWRG